MRGVRWSDRSRSWAVVPLAVVAWVAVSCGAPTLDGDSAASQILAQLNGPTAPSDAPEIDAVDCPDDVEVAAASTFDCTATEPDGGTWTIEVTQLDDEGTLDYRIEQPA